METVQTSKLRPNFRCAECELVNDCDCLDTTRILDLMAPLVRQVVDHLQADGSVLDYEVIERLALLVDRDDQRVREWEAWPDLGDAEDQKCDRALIEDLVGPWGYETPFRRTPEGIAARRKVPVERVRALLERFLADSRPSEAPARPFSCICSGDHGRQTGCSGVAGESGRCAWCVTNHRPKPRQRAGQSFLFDFVDAEVA
jgi:hypothetical protein